MPLSKKRSESVRRRNAAVCSWSGWDLIHLNNEWKSEADCHRLGPPQSPLTALSPPLSCPLSPLSPCTSLCLYHLFIFDPSLPPLSVTLTEYCMCIQ